MNVGQSDFLTDVLNENLTIVVFRKVGFIYCSLKEKYAACC